MTDRPADLPVAAPAQYAWTFECGHTTIGPNSDPPDACPVCGDISLWRKSPSLPVAAPAPPYECVYCHAQDHRPMMRGLRWKCANCGALNSLPDPPPPVAPDPASVAAPADTIRRAIGNPKYAENADALAALGVLLAALRVAEERNERLAAYAESVAALGDAISVEYQDIVEAARAVLAVEEEGT